MIIIPRIPPPSKTRPILGMPLTSLTIMASNNTLNITRKAIDVNNGPARKMKYLVLFFALVRLKCYDITVNLASR